MSSTTSSSNGSTSARAGALAERGGAPLAVGDERRGEERQLGAVDGEERLRQRPSRAARPPGTSPSAPSERRQHRRVGERSVDGADGGDLGARARGGRARRRAPPAARGRARGRARPATQPRQRRQLLVRCADNDHGRLGNSAPAGRPLGARASSRARAGSPCRAPCAASGHRPAGFPRCPPSAGYCRRMRATDLPGGAARRDDMGVSHAADGSAALAPERSARAASARSSRPPSAVIRVRSRSSTAATGGQAYRAAYLVTRDAHAAEDIAQEAFLQAIRVLDRFDRARPFAPWLHRIVTNRALDWARAHALRRPVEATREPVAPEARSDLSDDLAEAIGRLAPDQRAVVVLRYLLEHTPGEIAEMLDLPRGTVNSRLRRALDELAGDGRTRERRASSCWPPGSQDFEAPGEVEAGRARTPPRARGLRRAHAVRAGGACGLPRIVWPVLAALLRARAPSPSPAICARAARRAQERAPFGVQVSGRRGARARARRRLRPSTRAAACARSGPRQRRRPLAARLATPCSRRARRSSPCSVADGQVRWRVPATGPRLAAALVASSAPCRRAAAWRTSRAARSTSSAATGAARTSSRAHALAVAPAWRPRRRRPRARVRRPGRRSASSAADSRRPLWRVRGVRARRSRSAGAPTVASLAVLDAAGATLYSADRHAPAARLPARRHRARGRLRARGQPARRPAARRERPPQPARARSERAAARRSPPGAHGRRRPAALARRPQRADREPGGRRMDRDPPERRPPARLRDVGERLRAGFAPRALAWAG